MDVCRQIRFLRTQAQEQQREIGEDRFWMLPYEDFCADPAAFVAKVARDVLKRTVDEGPLRRGLQPFTPSRHQKVDQDTLHRIEECTAAGWAPDK